MFSTGFLRDVRAFLGTRRVIHAHRCATCDGVATLRLQVRVAKHGAGAPAFSFTPPPGTGGKGHTNLPFFFEGSCALLDSEAEWCFDSQRRLHVWLDGCADPSTVAFRGKTRAYLINVTKIGTGLALR